MKPWMHRSSLAAACALALLATSAAPPLAATLTGFVRNEAGAGLANVDLDFIELCSGDNIFLSGDKTAADGSFSVVVPSGTYDIHFTPPTGSTVVAGDRQEVAVSANASLGIITLHPGRLVSGVIRTPALAAAAGVDLKFVDRVTQERVYVGKDVSSATGAWSVRLPAGAWDIDFRPPLASPYADGVRQNLVVGASDVTGLSDVLRTGFTITGTVRDKNNNKIKNVDIDVFDTCTGERVPTAHDNTDANGNYSVVVPGGTYTFNYDPPVCQALEALRAPGTLVDRSRSFGTEQLRAAVPVSGVAVDHNGLPMANAKLKFYDVTAVGAPRQATGHDRTDATGAFHVYVPDGTYDVNIEPPAGMLDQVIHLNNVVTGLGTNVGTVQSEAGVALSGHVSGLGATPLANVDINVVDFVTRVSKRIAHDATDEAGNFTVVVPPGTYDIQYDPPGCSSYAPAAQEEVAVAGALALPSLAMVTGASAQGTVLDDGSLPAPNVDLDFYVAGTTHKIYTPGDQTAADGTYNVVVPPGTYDIKYVPSSLTRLRPEARAGVSMTFTQTLPLTVLASGLLVSGTVRDTATLAPVAGVTVEFFPSGGGAPLLTSHHTTSLLGAYNVAVAPGTYDLLFTPPVGSPFAPEWRHDVVVSADTPLSDELLALPTLGVPGGVNRALASLSAWPNPSRRHMRVAFAAPGGEAELAAWDLAGRRVATLWRGRAESAIEMPWSGVRDDGQPLPAGVYYLRLSRTGGGPAASRRVVLLD